MHKDPCLREVAELLRSAERPLFVTGAGLSADSGLPTYRGVGGLYEHELTEEGMPIQMALSHDVFAERPEISWKYLWQILQAIRNARCNRGHEVLAAIERAKPKTWVLTQNIDGYHRAAGSRNVIEIHGCHDELFCPKCGYRVETESVFDGFDGSSPVRPPRCGQCNGVIRPRVVLFGEALPARALGKLETVLTEEPRDLVLLIGTTGLFPYIGLPVQIAREQGVPTVEINPDQTALSHQVDYRLRYRAAEALAALWETP